MFTKEKCVHLCVRCKNSCRIIKFTFIHFIMNYICTEYYFYCSLGMCGVYVLKVSFIFIIKTTIVIISHNRAELMTGKFNFRLQDCTWFLTFYITVVWKSRMHHFTEKGESISSSWLQDGITIPDKIDEESDWIYRQRKILQTVQG